MTSSRKLDVLISTVPLSTVYLPLSTLYFLLSIFHSLLRSNPSR